MQRILLTVFAFFVFNNIAPAQTIKGQWKGSFLDQSSSSKNWGSDQCDYVLELEVSGKTVSGYSYTYFTDGGKKYYTICKLKGFFETGKKYVEVREVERTKTNVPSHIKNCFQVHRLTYFKQGDTETLEGTWIPAPDQDGDCGYGVTNLERRVLKSNVALFSNSTARSEMPVKKKPVPAKVPKSNPVAVAKTKPPPTKKENTELLLAKKGDVMEPIEMPLKKDPIQDKITAPTANFEKRNNTLIKTIEVENVSVKVSLYDNGEIDGDSISLFYNGKLILSHQRLSDKPITLNVNVDKDQATNELVMYAENLGTIPPNTALMVIYDGPNRYEVRITSDLQKSGTIRFVHKPEPAR